MCAVQNQAQKVDSIPPSNEWCGRGRKQEHQEDHRKRTVTYKDWHDMLPWVLLAYRTSIRSSTGATPYSLVYGTEAV